MTRLLLSPPILTTLVVGLVVSLVFGGCRGDFDPSGGDCTSDVEGNLLTDPSFERWNGESNAVWRGTAMLTPTKADPFECAYAGLVSSVAYDGIGQAVILAAPLPAQTTIEFEGEARYEEGSGAAPTVFINVATLSGGDYNDAAPVSGWSTDGRWHTVTAALLLPEGATTLDISIGGDEEPQTFAVDAAVLIARTP